MIDLAQLPDYLQSFVVGDVIDLVRRVKTGDSTVVDDYEQEEADNLPALETVIRGCLKASVGSRAGGSGRVRAS